MSSNEKDTLAADSTDFSLARISLWISVVLVTAGTLGGLGIVEPLIVAALTVALLRSAEEVVDGPAGAGPDEGEE